MTPEEKEKYYAIIEYNLGKRTMRSTVSKTDIVLEGLEALEHIKSCIEYDIDYLKRKLESDEISEVPTDLDIE